jgi:hypothetical protein
MRRAHLCQAVTRLSGHGLIASAAGLVMAIHGPAHALLVIDMFPGLRSSAPWAAEGSTPRQAGTAAQTCLSTDTACIEKQDFETYFCTGVSWPEGEFFGMSLVPPPGVNQEIDSLIRTLSPLSKKIFREQLRAPFEYLFVARNCLVRPVINPILTAAPHAGQRTSRTEIDALSPGLVGSWSLSID